MSESEEWAFPEVLQPDPGAVGFDLETVQNAAVAVRAAIPTDAFTAAGLGTERAGNGIVIDPGLVLTIGYLITEAASVWLHANDGSVVEGYPMAYDQATGFGLVRALGPLNAEVLPRETSATCGRGDTVYVIGHGGRPHSLKATLIDKREFAGYTHGFNHSRFARQVHDLLSVVSYLKKKHGKAPVLRASAAAHGRRTVDVLDALAALPHVLWEEPDEAGSLAEWVEEKALTDGGAEQREGLQR